MTYKPKLIVLSFSSYVESFINWGRPHPEDVDAFIFSCHPSHVYPVWGSVLTPEEEPSDPNNTTVPLEVVRAQNTLLHRWRNPYKIQHFKTYRCPCTGLRGPTKLTPETRNVLTPRSASTNRVDRTLIDENVLALWDLLRHELHDIYWRHNPGDTPSIVRLRFEPHDTGGDGTLVQNLNNAGYDVLYGNHLYRAKITCKQLEFEFK